jgi:hypothetical protein
MNYARIISGFIWGFMAYAFSNETLLVAGAVLVGIGLTDKATN